MLNKSNAYLFKFAWKSIRRNAGRSFFIGFSVSLAVFIAVWVVAFFDGLNHQIEQAVVNTNMGYFQLQEKSFAYSTDSSRPMDFASVKDLILDPSIRSASPELILDGNISAPEGTAGLTVIGIDPDLHQKFLPVAKHVKQGSFLVAEDPDSVVIGEELAKIFKFNVGDQLVLNYQDYLGELRSELLTIKGIYQFNSKGFEKKFIYISQKTWQLLYFKEDQNKTLFNRITIMADSLKAEPYLKEVFKKTDLVLRSWKNLNPEMAVVLAFHDGMINFFFLIIGVTIFMTILTPVQMLWQERMKELKMMTTLGINHSHFWKIGMFEVLQMIIASGILSIVVLVTVIGLQAHQGIDFSFLNDGVPLERAGILLPGRIFPRLTYQQILITFGFNIFVLGFSYIWSMHRTIKKLEGEA